MNSFIFAVASWSEYIYFFWTIFAVWRIAYPRHIFGPLILVVDWITYYSGRFPDRFFYYIPVVEDNTDLSRGSSDWSRYPKHLLYGHLKMDLRFYISTHSVNAAKHIAKTRFQPDTSKSLCDWLMLSSSIIDWERHLASIDSKSFDKSCSIIDALCNIFKFTWSRWCID